MSSSLSPAAGPQSQPIADSSTVPESGNVGTLVTPNGRRSVTAHEVDESTLSVRGKKSLPEADSSQNQPSESRTVKLVKPRQPSWITLDPIPEGIEEASIENGAGPDLDSPETRSSTPDPDSPSIDNFPPGPQEPTLRPSTPPSNVQEGFDNEQLTLGGYADTESWLDDIVSITTELSDVSRHSGAERLVSQDGIGELFSRPELGTAVGQIFKENSDLMSPGEQFPVNAATTPVANGETPALDDKCELASLSIEGGVGDNHSELASLSIEGGNPDNNSAVKSGGSLSIEGGGIESGGKTTNKLFQRVLGAIQSLLDVVKNNPLWTGFVVCSAIFLISLMTGNVYAAIFFAICALAFLGVALGVTTHNTLFGNQQNPSQTNSGQNQNQQNTPENKTPKTPEQSTDKTEPGSSPQADTGDTDGKFVMTDSRPPSATNRGSEPTARGNKASAVATQTVGEQNDDDLTRNIGKFLQFINENFSPFSNKTHAQEQRNRNSQDPDNEIDAQTLKEVSAAAVGLYDQFRHVTDYRDTNGSDTFQNARMREVERQTNQLMDLIKPTDEFIEQLTNKVYMQFSDPRLSPDPKAPALTIGEVRSRLASFADKDMQGIEFFDLLHEFIRAAKTYGNDRMKHRFGQVLPEAESTISPLQTSTSLSSSTASTVSDAESAIAPKDGLDNELHEEADKRHKEAVERLERELNISDSDLENPVLTEYSGMNKYTFLLDLRAEVLDWSRQQEQAIATEGLVGREYTARHYERLVGVELGKAVYSVASKLLSSRQEFPEIEKKFQSDEFDISKSENKKELLEYIFGKEEVNKAFENTVAMDGEKERAKNHYRRFVDK